MSKLKYKVGDKFRVPDNNDHWYQNSHGTFVIVEIHTKAALGPYRIERLSGNVPNGTPRIEAIEECERLADIYIEWEEDEE